MEVEEEKDPALGVRGDLGLRYSGLMGLLGGPTDDAVASACSSSHGCTCTRGCLAGCPSCRVEPPSPWKSDKLQLTIVLLVGA